LVSADRRGCSRQQNSGQRIGRYCVGHIIDSGKVEAWMRMSAVMMPNAPPLSRVNVGLPDELTGFGEFNDFTWVGWIASDGIAVGGKQIPIRRKYQSQRATPMRIVKAGGRAARQ
jgi:hypothetical protein